MAETDNGPGVRGAFVTSEKGMYVDELAGRLELVKLELEQLQESIRSHDSIMFQVKGWAVTVGLATAGLALTLGRPAIAVLGALATVAFFSIEAHRKSVQSRFIDRCLEIERALVRGSLDQLARDSSFVTPQIAHSVTASRSYQQKWSLFVPELARPSVFAVYTGIVLILILIAVVS